MEIFLEVLSQLGYLILYALLFYACVLLVKSEKKRTKRKDEQQQILNDIAYLRVLEILKM